MLLNWNTQNTMNITAMKALLVAKGILVAGENLSLNTAQKADGTKDLEWMRYWNNDKRIAVSIPIKVVKSIQANDADAQNLVLQAPETRTAEKGDYDAYRIVAVTPAEVTL